MHLEGDKNSTPIYINACISLEFKSIVLSHLKNDIVSRLVLRDFVILKYGVVKYAQVSTFGAIPPKFIIHNMRIMGRMVLLASTMNARVESMIDLMAPFNYLYLLQAIKNISGLNEGAINPSPSTAIISASIVQDLIQLLINESFLLLDHEHQVIFADFMGFTATDLPLSIHDMIAESQLQSQTM